MKSHQKTTGQLSEKETLALIQAKNEILNLKNQFKAIDETEDAQNYFFRFQKEIDLFEKNVDKNIKNLDQKANSNTIFLSGVTLMKCLRS